MFRKKQKFFASVNIIPEEYLKKNLINITHFNTSTFYIYIDFIFIKLSHIARIIIFIHLKLASYYHKICESM